MKIPIGSMESCCQICLFSKAPMIDPMLPFLSYISRQQNYLSTVIVIVIVITMLSLSLLLSS